VHSINSILMTTFFTAWDYHLSYLEFFAFITSVVGVGLGVLGPRSTWPWWNVSSLLYAILFFEEKYYASGFLQFIFIAGGFWGWFGWGTKGATPAKLSRRLNAYWLAAFAISWIALNPLLIHLGAAATLTDSFGFVGSCIAQVLMVKEKFETWPLWFVVDGVYTYQFWQGGQYLTSLLYLIFVGLAVAGWIRWNRESKKNAQAL